MKISKQETVMGVLVLLCSAGGIGLFLSSYTTGYYVFGEMNSGLIFLLTASGMTVEIAALVIRKKWGSQFWTTYLTFAVTALLMAGAILLIGDRVEGIGNCIVTDYDSGHGGEEAIYRSLMASGILMAGVIFNIIGSFSKRAEKQAHMQVI